MSSIRRRILAPLVPLTAVALLLAVVAVDSVVRADLMAGLDHSLELLAGGVGAALDVELDGTVEFDLDPSLQAEFEGAGGDGVYLVQGDAPPLRIASAGIPGAFVPGGAGGGGAGFSRVEWGGKRLRLRTVKIERTADDDPEGRAQWRSAFPGVPVPDPRPRTFRITVGRPTDSVDRTVAAMRRHLVALFGVLFLVLVLLPVGAVSRALHPLRTLSRQADTIGPEAVERRLDERGVDREVSSLVRALNRALERIGWALQRERRFAADAAHELRTPLTAVRTTCEVALRRERDAGELRGALEAVLRSELRMGELVKSLLSLARLEGQPGGVAGAVEGAADLAGVAREVVELCGVRASARGVMLELDAPGPVAVAGDAGLLVECVANLVENAVRHSPEGATVGVAVTAAPSPRVTVSDAGPGIPEEQREQVFERFYRVDPGRARSDGGAGLGLALVQEIARVHGARVTVTDAPGGGSRFTVNFPPAAPSERSAP